MTKIELDNIYVLEVFQGIFVTHFLQKKKNKNKKKNITLYIIFSQVKIKTNLSL